MRMIKGFLTAVMVLFFCVASYAVTISGNFTAVAQVTTAKSVAPGDKFAYVVTGTFSGQAVLEASNDGGQSWRVVDRFSSAASATYTNEDSGRSSTLYRFRCSAYTSGTIEVSIADVNTELQNVGRTLWQNKEGLTVLKITESGIETAGTISLSALTPSAVATTDSGGTLTGTALTNGQVLIGSTGSAPVAAAITGTANQVTVTNGAGTITLAAPQNLGTGSSTQHLRLGLGIAPDATITQVNSVSDALTSPIFDIRQASTGDAAMRFALGSTQSYAIGIDNSASDAFVLAGAASGSAELGTGNLLSVSTAGAVTVPALTASAALYTDTSKVLSSVALTDGQLLIGSTGANPAAAAITAGSGISVTNGAGSITIAKNGLIDGSGTANQIPYFSDADTLTSEVDQLTWSAADNRLGIGVSAPTQALHVVHAVANGGPIFHDTLESDGNGSFVYMASENTAGTVSNVSIESQSNNAANSSMKFRTGGTGTSTPGTLRMTIDESGNGLYAGEYRVGTNLVVGKQTAATSVDFPLEIEKAFSSSGGSSMYNTTNADGTDVAFFAAGDNAGGTPSNVSMGIQTANGAAGHFIVRTGATSAQGFGTNRFMISNTGNIRLGPTAAVATNATDGFPYMITMAGAASGVPTTITGSSAFHFDTTNDVFRIYDGGWIAFPSAVDAAQATGSYRTITTSAAQRSTIAAGTAGNGTAAASSNHTHQIPMTPACHVYNSAAVSAVTGTTTYMTFDTEAVDNDTMHAGGAPTRITITTAGLYLFVCQIDFASNNTNNRGIVLRMNGSLEVGYDMRLAATGVPTRCNISQIINCAAADYFEMGGYNDSGTNLDMNAGTTIFKAQYLGPVN